MRAKSMSHLVAPLERVLEEAQGRNVGSTGIGDGGNELGMGKVRDKVIASGVPNAESIACTVATDHLITCSVSNWGGYALAGALGVVLRSKTATLPSDREETELLERMRKAGARDGVSGKLDLTVDGMPLSMQLSVLRDLREIAEGGA
mmetsp:Transcript_4289/g.5710  ORF Transcript_4289/g.5710 Transcript_4289/m.5710 type:complete len:148 (+) Transcript_4289:81-524(+)